MTEGLAYTVPLLSGEREELSAVPAFELQLLLRRGEPVELRAELPRFEFAPVAAGAPAGRLRVLCAGEERAAIPLVYAEGAEIGRGP